MDVFGQRQGRLRPRGRLDPVRRTLTCNHAPVKRAARLFNTLLYLIEAQGRLVDKDERLTAIWSGRIVEKGDIVNAPAVATVSRSPCAQRRARMPSCRFNSLVAIVPVHIFGHL